MTTPVRVPWRQVEMPPGIARLPRDRRGFPVPWVSCWDHDGSHLTPEPADIHMGAYLVQVMAAECSHVAGQGEPKLAELCAANQRIGMTQRRCDACGEHIPGEAHFIGAITAIDRYREPPLHLECAVYSLQVCPGISTAPGIGVRICDTYDLSPSFLLASRTATPTPFPDFLTAVGYMQASQDNGVLIDAYATPVDPVVMTREEFLEEYL